MQDTKKITTPKKLPSPKVKHFKKCPQKFIVSFPVLENHNRMEYKELTQILKYLKKMSNNEYSFEFQLPMMAEMKPIC